jgi:hypothetical protein
MTKFGEKMNQDSDLRTLQKMYPRGWGQGGGRGQGWRGVLFTILMKNLKIDHLFALPLFEI